MTRSDRREQLGPVIGRMPEWKARMQMSYERFADPARWRQTAADLGITVRELQVALLMVKGLSLGEIGKALGISKGTVQTYNQRLHHRLRVRNRGELVSTIVLASGILLPANSKEYP